MLVGLAKARRLAIFLGKGLHHAHAGNGVGQHAGDFGPDAVDLLEAGLQPKAHRADHPDDERQRHQRDQRQPGVDGDQDHRRHDQHQDVGGKVEQVQRQKDANAVTLAADARHQITGALAAKVLQRHAQQVLVGGGAQVGPDALGHQRQDVGLGPRQPPGQQRRAEQPRQVECHQHGVDVLPVLKRNQHLVHQGHGQVRRHQAGGGAQERQRKTGEQLKAIRSGKAPEPKQRAGRRRGVDDFGADRAFVLIGRQRRFAAGATTPLQQRRGQPGHGALRINVKLIEQADRLQVVPQRETPGDQPSLGVIERQMTHPRMVMVLECQPGPVRPGLPTAVRRAAQQAPVGDQHQTGNKTKFVVQVHRQQG